MIETRRSCFCCFVSFLVGNTFCSGCPGKCCSTFEGGGHSVSTLTHNERRQDAPNYQWLFDVAQQTWWERGTQETNAVDWLILKSLRRTHREQCRSSSQSEKSRLLSWCLLHNEKIIANDRKTTYSAHYYTVYYIELSQNNAAIMSTIAYSSKSLMYLTSVFNRNKTLLPDRVYSPHGTFVDDPALGSLLATGRGLTDQYILTLLWQNGCYFWYFFILKCVFFVVVFFINDTLMRLNYDHTHFVSP